jgi:hypothetical protein
MNNGQADPGSQHHTISGDGVISTGPNTNINYAKGDGNRQSAGNVALSPAALDPWDQLPKELARIRLLLTDENGHAPSAGRDDAIEFVVDLERELPELRKSGADAPKKLRQRIKALVGVLLPVAGLIGGVADLESIIQHL